MIDGKLIVISSKFSGGLRPVLKKAYVRITHGFTVFCCLMIALQPLTAELAYAQQIIIDPNGNVGFTPQVKTVRRAPVVNIAKPNQGGVSHNKYKKLNVDTNGAVLNNSTKSVNTQVAGQIAGNPNLTNGTASVIVNEVTSTARSTLNGTIEVAGDRAGVIIANPNGISCDGCSFANTTEGTLTTGRPIVNGGSVSLDVVSGTITVGRKGLNGASTGLSSLNLIGRTVVIDGKVTAIDGINVQGGAQRYDLANKRTTKKLAGAGAAPDYVVDGRQYGAMEAGRIQIIGNESGLGVRTLGAVQSTTGDVTIKSAGDTRVRSVASAGRVTLGSDATLTVDRDITSATSNVDLYGAAKVALNARAGLYGRSGVTVSGDTLSFKGTLQSSAGIDLAAQRALNYAAYGTSGTEFTFSATTDLEIQDATIVAQDLRVNGANAAVRVEDAAIFLGGSANIVAGDFYLGRDVVIDGLSAGNAPSVRVAVSNDFTNAADLRSFDDFLFSNAGDLINTETGVIFGAEIDRTGNGDVFNAGAIIASQSVSLSYGSLFNAETGIVAANEIAISVNRILENKGQIIAQGNASLTALNEIRNEGVVQAIHLAVVAPKIETTGTSQTRGLDVVSLTAKGGSIVTNGILSSDDRLTISSDAFTNKGWVAASGLIDINAATIRNTGSVNAGEYLRAIASKTLRNDGELISYDRIWLAAGQTVDNYANLIADGTLSVTGASFRNLGTDAFVRAKLGNLATANITNQGRVFLKDRFYRWGNIDTFDNSGVFASEDYIYIKGRTSASRFILRDGGALISGLSFGDGSEALTAGKSVNLNFASMTLAGDVQAGGHVYLTTPGTLNITGDVAAGQNLRTWSTSVVTGADASLRAEGYGYFTNNGYIINNGTMAFGDRIITRGGTRGLTNTGVIHADRTSLEAMAGTFTNSGVFQTTGNLVAISQNINNTGLLQAGNALTVYARQTIGTNADGSARYRRGVWNNEGTLTAANTLTIYGGSVTTGEDSYISASRMNVYASTFVNRANIVLDGTSTNYWTTSGQFANYGSAYAEGSLVTSAASTFVDAKSLLASDKTLVINSTGETQMHGTLAARNISLSGDTLRSYSQSSAIANEDLRLTATGGTIVTRGELAAGDDLVVRADVYDLGGNLYGEKVTFAAQTDGVVRGTVYSSTFANMSVANGRFANVGTIQARDKLTVTADRVANYSTGSISATDIDLIADDWVYNSGKIFGARSLLLEGDGRVTNATTGKITGVSAAVNGDQFYNYGSVDVFGLYATVDDLVYNKGSIKTKVYAGINSGRLYNYAGASITSDDHLHLQTAGQLNNYEGGVLRGDTIDLRGGQFYNYGAVRAGKVLNVSDTAKGIYNTTTGTIYGNEIYLSAGTWLLNRGRIGTSATDVVSLASGSSLRNEGVIYGKDIGLDGGSYTLSSGAIYASGFAKLEAATNVYQRGVIRSKNLHIVAGGIVYNDGDARATNEALIDADSIQNRLVDGTRAYLQARELVLLAKTSITNHGGLYGTAALAVQTETGNIYNSADGYLKGPKISLVSDKGWITVNRNTYASNEIVVQGRGMSLNGYLYAGNLVSLKSTESDIRVASYVRSKKVLVDAARYIVANSGSFRGHELTQLVADDILRLTPSQVSARTSVGTSTSSSIVRSSGIDQSISGQSLQYIASYGDLMKAYGYNSFWGTYHYNRWGKNEKRDITFDGLAYIASYGDLINAYGANAEKGAYHYIRWGKNEKRTIRFDPEQYLRNYAGLRNAYGNDLRAATLHYIKWGYKEKRKFTPIAGAMSMSQWSAFVASKPALTAAKAANWQSRQSTTKTTSHTWRNELRTTDSKLEVVSGPLKDLYIELRKGSLGSQGTDLQTTLLTRTISTSRTQTIKGAMTTALYNAANQNYAHSQTLAGGATRWHTYERAAINATGDVSLIARTGDILLTGSVKAAGNVYLYAGDRLGLRNVKLQAADTLHLEGRGNVLRYGGVTLTPGKALEISTNASLSTSTWLTRTDLAYDVTLFARNLTVDRSYRAANNNITFLASHNLVQRNEVVTAKKIDYQAGLDVVIDFDPFEWRSENSSSLTGGTGWDVRNLGRAGYSLVSGTGGMSIYAGRDVKLISGKLYSSRDIDITASNSIISQPVYKENTRTNRPGSVGWGFSSGYQGVMSGHAASKVSIYELRAYENHIRAGRDITLTAGNSVTMIGTQLVTSGGDITVSALNGGVTMVAAPGQWIYDYTSVRTWRSGFLGWKKNRETTEVDALKDLYKPTLVSAAKGDIVIESTGSNGAHASIITAGTKFTAKNVSLATPNGNITAGTYRQRNEYKKKVHKTSKLFGFIPWGSSNSTNVSNTLINYGNNFHADTLLSLAAPKGTISITGGTLRGEKVKITAKKLEILAAINTERTEYNSRRDNMITITTITSGKVKETADIPQITSTLPIEFNLGGEVTIGAAARGTDLNSQLINIVGTRQFSNETLGLADPTQQNQANTQSGEIDRTFLFAYDLPGASDGAQFAYLDTLMTDFGATYHTFDLRDQEWYDKQVQLNPAFKALLTAVVTYATGGLGFGAAGPLTSGALTAATNSVIVGVVEGTITGDMDMGGILRGALLAGVSSAISGYLTDQINLGGYTDTLPDINNLDDLITPAAIVDRLGDRVISSVVSNVVHGQDPFEGLNNLGQTFLVSELMAIAQFGIGELGEGNTDWEGSVPHLLLHGGVGCLAMVTVQGNCGAGFFAAAGQSLLAGSDLSIEQKTELAPLLGSLLGYVFSDGNATNVSFGGTIADSALKNNYLSHVQWQSLIGEFGQCNGDETCLERVLSEYRNLSMLQEAAMAQCFGNVVCLAPHVIAISETADNAEINNFLAGLNPQSFGNNTDLLNLMNQIYAVQTTSIIAVGLSDSRLTGAYNYAYSMYPEWSANPANCGGLSAIDCMAKFQQTEIHSLGGLVHEYQTGQSAIAMLTIGAGGVALTIAPVALAALSRCVMNPACLANLQVGSAEAVLGLTGATAGNTFVTVGAAGTAVAGRLIFTNGDEIIKIVDDLGRVFEPATATQTFDDLGRLLVRQSDGTYGYIDNVGNSFTPTIVDSAFNDILINGRIPTRRAQFDNWASGLTSNEIDQIWANPELRSNFTDMIRPGGMHEWCMCKHFDQFTDWGLSVDDVRGLSTATDELRWTVPDDIPNIGGLEGGHISAPGNAPFTGSATFHNELSTLITNSSSMDDFWTSLPTLADRWSIDPSILPVRP